MAHSKHVSEYVEEMLECTVCLNTVTNPHTLQQCLHSYCKDCIDQLIQKQNNQPPGVKCPVCRSYSLTNQIRSNFFIKDLAEMHSSTKYLNAKKICDHCETDIGHPSWKCLDCKIALCDHCKKLHLKLKLLQGHRVIPLTEDSDDAVDQIVFCSIHHDQPIQLYCEPCQLPLCIKCKVTKHNPHDTKTIEEVLEELVPEMQAGMEDIDRYITANAKSSDDMDAKINEVKQTFLVCHEKVDKKATERVNEIKAAQKIIKDQLKKQEKQELKKLEDIKDSLDKHQKEGENLKRVVLTSLNKARHATLLTELIQGRLQDKIKDIKENKQKQVLCKISLPQVEGSDYIWNRMKQEGLLCKLVFNIMGMLLVIGSNIREVMPSGSRYWDNTFNLDYFAKSWKKILEIKLKSNCRRAYLVKGQIWAPVGSNCIDIYSKLGQLVKTIQIKNPMSVEETLTNDVFVACYKESGLFVITDNDIPVKLCDGTYSDVCCYNDKVYVIGYKDKVILEFVYYDDVVKPQSEKWQQTRKIQLDNYEEPHYYDKFLVTNHGHDGGPLHFYVSSWNCHTIYKYNEQGQQIRKYGGFSEKGEGKLSSPYLCGIDSQSHILVADSFNNKYKIMDPESGQWSDTGLTGERGVYIYDAKIDSDGFLWLSQYNGNNYIITKHEQ